MNVLNDFILLLKSARLEYFPVLVQNKFYPGLIYILRPFFTLVIILYVNVLLIVHFLSLLFLYLLSILLCNFKIRFRDVQLQRFVCVSLSTEQQQEFASSRNTSVTLNNANEVSFYFPNRIKSVISPFQDCARHMFDI